MEDSRDKNKFEDKQEYTGKEALQRGTFDIRSELGKIQTELEALKVKYEQFFLGIIPREPEKEHSELKLNFKYLQQAPFKTTELAYRLKSIETRYNTYNSYWQRILRERESGNYKRDVFKTELRSRQKEEILRENSKEGAKEKSMQALFNAYKTALENETGRLQKLDFNAFKMSLYKKAKQFKEKNGASGVKFKVVLREGVVNVEAESK